MKRLVAPLLSIVVLVAAAAALLTYLSGDAPDQRLVLSEVQGEVHVRDALGEQVAQAGTVLEPSDRIATGQGSQAVLTMGDDTRIRLGAGATVQVRAQDDTTVTLELEGGALQATVRPGSSALRVGSRGRHVLTTDGAFEAGVGEDGTFVVEMSEGSAMTSGFEGVSPRLSAGDRATVTADGAATITAIPDELLLAVQWPEQRRMRETATAVSGTTVPGARVRIEGGGGAIEVVADAAGHFAVQIPLAEGTNGLRAEAVDQLGNVAMVELDGAIEVDSRGPTFRGGVEYGRAGTGPR